MDPSLTCLNALEGSGLVALDALEDIAANKHPCDCITKENVQHLLIGIFILACGFFTALFAALLGVILWSYTR